MDCRPASAGKCPATSLRQFFRDIAPHAVVARERLLRCVDIKAGAEPEIVGAGGIAGHLFAARAGVRRDEDQSEFSAGAAEFAFFRDVGVGAGQSRQIPDDRQPCAILMGRDIDRKCHVGPGLAAGVLVNALHAAVRFVERNGLHCHELATPAPRRVVSGHAVLDCQPYQFGGCAHAELLAHDRGSVGDRLVGGMDQPRDFGQAFSCTEQAQYLHLARGQF